MPFTRNYCINLLKTLTFFSLFLFLGARAHSQNIKEDFEISTIWFGFDGGAFSTITNPHQSELNQSNKVGHLIKVVGKSWGGTYYDIVEPVVFFINNINFVELFYGNQRAVFNLYKSI